MRIAQVAGLLAATLASIGCDGECRPVLQGGVASQPALPGPLLPGELMIGENPAPEGGWILCDDDHDVWEKCAEPDCYCHRFG